MVTTGARGLSIMEALLQEALDMQAAGILDPKVEDILLKISQIQKDLEQTQAEAKELDKIREAAQKEFQQLSEQRRKLQEVLAGKQETVQMLSLRRDNFLDKEERERRQMAEHKKKLADLNAELTEEKLKQRRQRMEYEDQLKDMMAKHKNLAEIYNPKRLEAEISRMEERIKELTHEEKEKREKLKEVEEREACMIEEGIITPENVFLRSKEAACAIEMIEGENARAKSLLEKAKADHAEMLEKFSRLDAELAEKEKQLSQMQAASSTNRPRNPTKYTTHRINKI